MYRRWIHTGKRRKQQRVLNQEVRRVNRGIEEDPLWRGRFFVKQIRSEFYTYEDRSGSTLYCLLKLCDKKTKKTKYINLGLNEITVFGKLWWEMNDFITEYVEVWRSRNDSDFDDPYQDTTDYTQVSWGDSDGD